MFQKDIEGQQSIFDKALDKAKADGEACRFSGFKCNKEYRFVVADEINDNQCPHICCRLCSELLCGVKCLGSDKDKSKLTYKQIEKGFHDYGKGDFPYPEKRNDWYDVMILYRYRFGNDYKTIEVKAAYYNFEFNLYALPTEAPKASGEIVAWRYLKEEEI